MLPVILDVFRNSVLIKLGHLELRQARLCQNKGKEQADNFSCSMLSFSINDQQSIGPASQGKRRILDSLSLSRNSAGMPRILLVHIELNRRTLFDCAREPGAIHWRRQGKSG